MTSITSDLRSSFLRKASQLLATTAPAISAEIQSTRRDFGDEAAKSSPHACAACGSIFIPGWNCKFLRDSKTPRRTRQDRITGKTKTKTVQLECSLCSSVTTIRSRKSGGKKPLSEKAQRKPKADSTASAKISDLAVDEPRIAATTATPSKAEPGSKKRSRSNKSSLQAMVAAKKSSEQQKGQGLDLMDFMKT